MESIDRNEGRPLVSVLTTVYNHEKFLPDYFRGILMQKASFPFEVIIHDDASTDNSAAIIKEYVKKYPDIFKPIFQVENQYSQGIFIDQIFLFPKARGKYIAICEGDDYWTDPLKLEKQVNFLEAHDDYIVCSHTYAVLNQNTGYKRLYYENYKINFIRENGFVYFPYNLDNYFGNWYTQPLSCMFRNETFIREIPYNKYRYYRDNILFYYILTKGLGALLKDNMGVYRKQASGIFSGNTREENFKIEIENSLCIYDLEKDNRALYSVISATSWLNVLYIKKWRFWSIYNVYKRFSNKIPVLKRFAIINKTISLIIKTNLLSLFHKANIAL